jgi:hypothetical protein
MQIPFQAAMKPEAKDRIKMGFKSSRPGHKAVFLNILTAF